MTTFSLSPMDKLNELIDKMIEKRRETLSKKITRYPRTHFIASDIHDCDRYMVHSVLDWEKRALHDEGLQALFDAGNKEEDNVKRRLADDGWQMIEQQTPFEVKNRAGEMICRGKIDGKILYNRQGIPCEIKSMDGNIFRGINSLDDFHKKPHLRKYLRQIQLYMYGNNAEAGLFILSDFRREKYLPVALDLGECELILKRLETNWEHVKSKTYPERSGNTELCARCPFITVCLPPLKNEGAKMVDTPELKEALDRREELAEAAGEYDDLDKRLKEEFRGVQDTIIGLKWRIMGKETKPRKTIDTEAIPADILKKVTIYGEPGWKTTIIRLDQAKGKKG